MIIWLQIYICAIAMSDIVETFWARMFWLVTAIVSCAGALISYDNLKDRVKRLEEQAKEGDKDNG